MIRVRMNDGTVECFCADGKDEPSMQVVDRALRIFYGPSPVFRTVIPLANVLRADYLPEPARGRTARQWAERFAKLRDHVNAWRDGDLSEVKYKAGSRSGGTLAWITTLLDMVNTKD